MRSPQAAAFAASSQVLLFEMMEGHGLSHIRRFMPGDSRCSSIEGARMSEAVSETVQRLQLAAMFCMVGRVTLSSLSPLSVGPFWTAQRFRVRLGLSHLHAVLEGQPPYYSRDRARVSAWTTPDRLLQKLSPHARIHCFETS